MVGGGPGTLKSVYDSISRNIPVVIVKDSGRAADIMADAYQTKLENSNEEDEDKNDRKLKTDIREQIIKEFEKELKGKGIDNLVDYVLMSLKRPNLLTVYDKDSEKEFDLTMFKAVFKAKNNIENMRLGLAWNKPDVLKRLISEREAPWEDVKKWIQENIKLRNLRDEEASNPCDAFGEVKFVEHDQKIAKFVRVDHQTPMDIIINLIIYHWNFSCQTYLFL
ncbi:transient receptor potential cation channel subfamily M member-like 2 isoform X1 [Octopus sinensis]|uniref:Transient receptor potential cation channel subfamily M member-like 2 isoform X1 n=1 Tax=Octopus sinensis TaxID=2607531 RepID=A0A6P7T812_9MOLL|nr:transient receptor potential cation channel subfamily M member-like 2 isoform X1 [Octopus sinensis]